MSCQRRFVNTSGLTLLAAAALIAARAHAAVVGPNDPPDLGNTPPDLGTIVNPNVILTFDDSGSMAWTHMGDGRPYDGKDTINSSWNGPWRCANVIDPRVTNNKNPLSRAMNGVYYNPNITYAPPLKEDGTQFPNADATLTGVWQDGIAVNRPANAVSAGAPAFSDNPDGAASSNSGAVTNLMGQKTTAILSCITNNSSPAGCLPSQAKSASCPSNVTGNANYVPNSCQQAAGTCTSGKCYWTYQFYGSTTDNRWQCGTASTSDGNWTAARSVQNPFDGTVADPDTGAKPNGGPVYWRFKQSAESQLTTDPATGRFTSSALLALYNASNWEAVSVPSSQYQNFANWYAYYRYRNLMARTAMSRVFGVIGTPTSANIRVLWQNLNNTKYGGGGGSLTGLNGLPIATLTDNNTDPYGSGTPYRQAFFNWLYQIGASGSTPSRSAAVRAGNYLCGNGLNGNCNTYAASGQANSKNPWWNESSSGSGAVQELACRQNFHILMTDGLYNSPNASVSGNGSNAASSASLTGNPPEPVNDPTTYTPGTGKSPTTLYNHPGWTKDADTGSSYSDIAFYYWINNLRSDFKTKYPKDSVPSYFPDQTTGVTAAAAAVDPKDPGATPEVFWNPLNDPATWPHLVQYAVTLGAFGNLEFSRDVDCNLDSGFGVGNDDLCKLRTGQQNSTGAIGWPQPNGSGSGIPANIDDLWHAALNARGSFFVATNPQSLISQLTNVLRNVASRVGSSVAQSANSSIATSTTAAYTGGYNSSGWAGFLQYQKLDPNTGVPTGPIIWDAACVLTGGLCASTGGGSVSTQPNPTWDQRVIFTSVGNPGALTGAPFEWANLPSSGNEAKALSLDPTTTHPDTTTGLLINGSIVNGTADANGQYRLQYIRGQRKYESAPTPTANPVTFRPRTSVLGAIVNSQVVYHALPNSGWQDIYPAGSPEQTAGVSGNTYEAFVKGVAARNPNPMVYVGANDGMLHAFDAGTGVERWAYVPNLLYNNGQLDQLTNPASTLVNTVDDTPIIQDVFFTTDNSWHTILVDSMRFGGRGIFALDITNGDLINSETTGNPFLWEFTSQQDSDLGYSYATTNIARLRCNKSPCKGTSGTGGTWVVLVTSGYFPQCLPAAQGSSTCATNGYSANDTAAGATSPKNAGPTYLWVLNAVDGSLIAKIPTTSGVISYGLSTPAVVDFGLDQLDDVVVAGDLAGNLWRFDLSNPDSTQWASGVDVIFKTYTNNSACGSSNTSGIGCEPISVQPVAFPDTVHGGVIYVFGSGEYLGSSDNTTSSVYTPQHYFGVRDFGTHFSAADGGSSYPFHESDLNTFTLTQDAQGVRSLPYAPTSTVAHPRGWQIPLNIPGAAGERDATTATPLFSAGAALLTSLIPGQNQDPCQPGRSGALMAVNASTGGPAVPKTGSASTAVVGSIVTNPPASGSISAISVLGGGTIILPGMGAGPGNTPPQLSGLTPVWRRTSWSELLNQL
jgi:type IV pilus assembly protein PilY1